MPITPVGLNDIDEGKMAERDRKWFPAKCMALPQRVDLSRAVTIKKPAIILIGCSVLDRVESSPVSTTAVVLCSCYDIL
jgi:hypothetical protein